MKLFVLLVIFYVSSGNPKEIPSFLHVCNRNEPDLEKCIIKSVEDLRPILIEGVPEYNIPSIEPMIISDLLADKLKDLVLNITNVKAYGCSKFVVNSVKMNLETLDCNLDIDFPVLRIEADYNVDGKLLMLNIHGKGLFQANITDICSTSNLKGEFVEKDGNKYMHYNSVHTKAKFSGGVVKLENPNADKVLMQIMNDVANKNLEMFAKELMPGIQKALSDIFLNIGNDIVKDFTFDQLFPQ